MTNSKHVPKRRFKEFESDGEWEFSRFGELVVRVSESMMNSSFPNVEYEDVIPGKGQLNKNIHGKTNNKKGIRFLEGDVLYGKLRPYLKNWLLSDFKGIAVGDWWVLRSSELDSKFLYNFIQTEKYQVVANRSTGTKMPRSDWETVKDSDILFPSNFEQKKLGDFFQTIDSLISNHQHKLDKLKDLKKAYLTEMFPAEGECVPKRRFPGFEGEWEHKKLGQLMDVGSVKRVHQSDWRDRGVRFLRARDIVSESKNKKPDDLLYIDEELYKKYSAISGMVEKGDLLVTGVGTIGVPMLVESSEPLYFKDGNIIWFKNKNLLDGHFFYYSFTARAIQKFIGDVAGVGTVGTYTIDSGKNTPILLPVTKEEQVVIGDFFKKLDQSISLQQQKLDKLNDLKKAYLNELFV